MDRDEVRRLGEVLTAAASSSDKVGIRWYRAVRNQVQQAVGDRESLEAILPSDPIVSTRETVIEGDLILRAGAAYLHSIAATGSGSSYRDLAAADLMDQVQRLLEEEQVHPAAPIVLAGAALEESLRDRVENHDLTVEGRPGIANYAVALKKRGVLSETDRAMAETVGKIRNDAAHGRFDELDRTQANVVMSEVSLLLGKLHSASQRESESKEAQVDDLRDM